MYGSSPLWLIVVRFKLLFMGVSAVQLSDLIARSAASSMQLFRPTLICDADPLQDDVRVHQYELLVSTGRIADAVNISWNQI